MCWLESGSDRSTLRLFLDSGGGDGVVPCRSCRLTVFPPAFVVVVCHCSTLDVEVLGKQAPEFTGHLGAVGVKVLKDARSGCKALGDPRGRARLPFRQCPAPSPHSPDTVTASGRVGSMHTGTLTVGLVTISPGKRPRFWPSRPCI